MHLKPNPISGDGYHDCRLIGVFLIPGRADLLIEDPNGERICVRMEGVKYLLGMEVLQGNIIDCIDCHEIRTDEIANAVMEELCATGSQYFTKKVVADAASAGHFLGKHFLAVRPSYGAEVYVIAESVTERTVPKD